MSTPVNLTVNVGGIELANPVMTAAGTSGYSDELSGYFDLACLGAVVAKSLSCFPWDGNPPLRITGTQGGMLNSVGLQGMGIREWVDGHLPRLLERKAKPVLSVWGRSTKDFIEVANLLRPLAGKVVAVEANVSCPNTEDSKKLFAHSAQMTAQIVQILSQSGIPIWAKLSPNVPDITEIAGAALTAGASALTLINTLVGAKIDIEARRPALGGVTGGLSGPALHPVAVRCVMQCRESFPDAGIIGVGGVMNGRDAVELMMAGANAVQVGTATFLNPRAPMDVLNGLKSWCADRGVSEVKEIVGAALPSG